MTLAEKNGLQRQNVVQFVETLFPGHIFKGTVILYCSCSPLAHRETHN